MVAGNGIDEHGRSTQYIVMDNIYRYTAFASLSWLTISTDTHIFGSPCSGSDLSILVFYSPGTKDF